MRTTFLALAFAAAASAAPLTKRWEYLKYYDLQGHRGGRGEAIENTLPAFGHALINGVTTLEMDFGVTQDGHAVIWHDEWIYPEKCFDTGPVVENDPVFPYVGKYIANLTLAQVKSLDCGSQRLDDFSLQYVVPGQKIATVEEVFDFVDCATDEPVLFNIESKVDGDFRNYTRAPEDFNDVFLSILEKRGAEFIDRVTHQSFDWRSIIISKERMPSLRTSALCDDTTIWAYPEGATTGNLSVHGTGPSNWLAGIDVDSFEGETVGERVVRAAHSIKADFLSPTATSYASTAQDPALEGWIPFTNKTMVETAHELGMMVKPWTPNTLNLIDYLISLPVDGYITDYPENHRRYLEVEHPEFKLAPKADKKRVNKCLAKLNQRHNVTSTVPVWSEAA
ncbi:hypothetical protein JCM10207_006119 [Rhodosporidiobolus poonsookiae]